MANVTNIDRPGANHPKNGWRWVHDYSPEIVRLYLFVTSICDWFFWHSVINNYAPAALKNYRCDESRACELLECLDEAFTGSSEESCLLSDLMWDQYQFPEIELVIRGAAQDWRDISEISSSLFTWSTTWTDERLILETYMKRVFFKRSHIFNSGNYHDVINWLDIYDMEINETYRAWIEEKPIQIKQDIEKKIDLFRKHAAFVPNGHVRRQWYSEATYLGLGHKETVKHWNFLSEYLSQKLKFHRARINIVEESMKSRFPLRQVLRNMDNQLYDFGRSAVDFSETRIKLFMKDR